VAGAVVFAGAVTMIFVAFGVVLAEMPRIVAGVARLVSVA
jgi:hypothetical protein